MNKVLSVIIPAYNMECYIEHCLMSILNAESVLNKIQIIVVNDGSTDNTSSIAHEIAKNYPDIIEVVDKKNGNYGSAVNCGLQRVVGRYFKVLDSDDSFDTSALCNVVDCLSNIDLCDMVVVGYRLHNDKGRTIKIVKPKGVEFGKIYDAKIFDIRENKKCFWMHGIIYNVAIIKKCHLHLQEGISYTDTEYCYYPWNVVEKIVFIDDLLYKYLVGRNGQTVSDESYIKNKNHLLKIIMRILKEDGHSLMQESIISSNKKCVLGNALYAYYRAVLVLSKQNKEDDDNLRNLDNILMSFPSLYKETDDIRIYRLFRVVKRWRDENKYSNSFVVNIVGRLVRLIR